MTTNPEMNALIDTEAESIRAYFAQLLPTDSPGMSIDALASHLVRNRIQREDAQKSAYGGLVKALEEIEEAANRCEEISPGWLLAVAQAALKGLATDPPPSTRIFRNEAGVPEEHKKEGP